MIYSMIFLLNSLANKKVILSRLTYSLDNIASFVVYVFLCQFYQKYLKGRETFKWYLFHKEFTDGSQLQWFKSSCMEKYDWP